MYGEPSTWRFQTYTQYVKYYNIKCDIHTIGKILQYQTQYVHSIGKLLLCKIKKVPRGIQGEKSTSSSKDMASSRNLVSTIGAQASPKVEDGTRCPEG